MFRRKPSSFPFFSVSEQPEQGECIELTFFSSGMAPYNFITVQTGSFLSQLNSFDDLFSRRTLLTLGLIATVVGCTGLAVARVRRRIPPTVI